MNRIIHRIVGLFVLATLTSSPAGAQQAGNDPLGTNECRIYIGTYTGPKSKGIYQCRMDLTTGALSKLDLATETQNPAFIDIDPRKRRLFAANEISRFEGQSTGAVSAYVIEPNSGKLIVMDERSSAGDGPCHILIDNAGENALVANYGGGSVAALPIKRDGRLGDANNFFQLEGRSIVPDRQTKPHAHCMTLDASNHFAFACDLGTDKIWVYHYGTPKESSPFAPAARAGAGKLIPSEAPFVSIKPGSGPRHLVFSPNGNFAYLINELSGTIMVFSYSPEAGVLHEIQTISTLPDDFKGHNLCAEIAVHPSGKFVYGSNRGHDSIAVFSVDAEKGTLTFVQREPSQGKNPRHFTIDPKGKFLVAANQDSDNLVVFSIDGKSGQLKPTGNTLEVPSPVCVKFLPPAAAN